MNISEIRIYREDDNEVLKGFVNITLNNAISIKGIRIINANEKRFAVMPSYEYQGIIKSIAFPINQNTRNELEKMILSLYDEMIGKDLKFIERKYDSSNGLYINSIKMNNYGFLYNTRAIFDITVNDEYVLKGIKLLYKDNHYFIVMPSHYVKNKYIDYYHPIDNDTRKKIEEILINIYNQSKKGINLFDNHSQKDIYTTTFLDFV